MNSISPIQPIALFDIQKKYRAKHRIPSYEERIRLLRKLKTAIKTAEIPLKEALHEDLRKSHAETDLTEVMTALTEVTHTMKHLHDWMRSTSAPTPLTLFGSQSEIRLEPKGTVLVIAPWNYPFSLAINPLAAALAAGNSVIVKPSELTPHTSRLLKEILEATFRPEEVGVLEGGPDVSQALLELPFDHIFFTGSTRVGKIVAEAAAKNLTPVTLELGGKSPTIIDETADLALAARRIMWGKFLNGGQTCVAPDYVLLPEAQLDEFIKQSKLVLAEFYGEKEASRENTPDFCRIVSTPHAQRLQDLLAEAVQRGAAIHAGGLCDSAERFISPTLVSQVPADCGLMREEIFGPILPILTYRTPEELDAIILGRDKPLALYIFSENKESIERLLNRFPSGGVCINGTVAHLANPDLPFGGVGGSGMGNYHGFHGFRTFSHERSVMTQKRLFALDWFQPPFHSATLKRIRWAMKLFT